MRSLVDKLSANKGVVAALLFTALFLGVAMHYLFDENYLVLLVPAAMLMVWLFMMYRDESLALMALFTPFAVDYALIGKTSLSMPVEPMMIVFTVVFLFQELLMHRFDKRVLRHPVSILIMLSLVWMVFTSIVSLKPVESFKFTAARLWFVIPFFYAAALSFQKTRHIKMFYWAYAISLASSTFFEEAVLRMERLRAFFFSSIPILSSFTPASSGSIMIRPQYSHTMIFLCILISS